MTQSPSTIPTLTHETIATGAHTLARRDPHLARVYDRLGPPPLWERAPGFPTMVNIVLEQQVSLPSARSAFSKLREASGEITPARFLQFNDVELKTIGFSRQKAGYCRGLAQSIISGETDLERLAEMDDAAAHAALLRIRGIGAWSAGIYLLMVLLRPDTWPAGDLALAVAAQEVKALPARPTQDELGQMAESWRPLRAVAARMLWQAYLDKRGQL